MTGRGRRRPTYLEYVRANPHAQTDDPFIKDHFDRIFAGDPTAIQEFNDHILYLRNNRPENSPRLNPRIFEDNYTSDDGPPPSRRP